MSITVRYNLARPAKSYQAMQREEATTVTFSLFALRKHNEDSAPDSTSALIKMSVRGWLAATQHHLPTLGPRG